MHVYRALITRLFVQTIVQKIVGGIVGGFVVGIVAGAVQAQPQDVDLRRLPEAPRLELKRAIERTSKSEVWVGSYRVFENRETRAGRELTLDLVVLPAKTESPKPDPIVFLAGGPGQAASQLFRRWVGSWMRAERDIVFVDQRGTGGHHRLSVEWRAGLGYLDRIFDRASFEQSLSKLAARADLRWYTTPVAADDLSEVLRALGYDQVNLIGGSYGTRMALVFLRRHEARVRSAILNGVAPIAFKNPLYHAAAAQSGFDAICKEVAADAEYRRVFGNLREKLDEILARLADTPQSVELAAGKGEEPTTVELSRAAFLGALRVMMYYTAANRRVPLMLTRAHAGDYSEFARTALQGKRALRDGLAFGMLMCVVGTEDIPRIEEDEIMSATSGSLWGATRVREQLEIASFWPRGIIPDDYGEPVRSQRPVLLLSGTHDPVTPPRWGAEAAEHLPNSKHVVVAGCHGVAGACVTQIMRRFLDDPDVRSLDTSCAESVRLPRFVLPKGPARK